jgi:CheY-like chemotaxis protein
VLIAITGYGQTEDRLRAQAAGFDYHFVKPVDIDSLLKLLSSLTTVQNGIFPDNLPVNRGHY